MKQSNFTFIALLLFLSIFSGSCCKNKCRGDVQDFTAGEKEWLPSIYNQPDSVYFVSDQGNRILLKTGSPSGFRGKLWCEGPFCCDCHDEDDYYGKWEIEYSKNDSINFSFIVNIQKSINSFSVNFSYFFSNLKYKESSEKRFSSFSSFNNKLQIGKRDFSDVYVKDSLLVGISSYIKTNLPSKIFFNKHYGLIGFETEMGNL